MRDLTGQDAAALDAPPLLETRALVVKAGGRTLLDGIDLSLRPGQRMAIMGPNGAGKSLLLRALHGLLDPAEGAVLWNGTPLGRTARQAQAMVFQRPVLLRRSVLGNLRFALAARGIPRAERGWRAEEALERAGLEEAARKPARWLSGGQQQRLALAMALAGQPQLVFLDEPTASLDPAATQAVEAMLADAHAEGVATIMVTHDAGQARRVADRLVFLSAGRVAETGFLHQTLAAPRSGPLRAWMAGELWLAEQQDGRV